MDKFSQQFKDNLENQPRPNFEDGDWMDLQQRLDNQSKPANSNYRLLGWIAATAILLLLVGSNWFLFNALEKTNQKIEHLSVSTDTIQITKVVYQRDTIYINKEVVVYGDNHKKENSSARSFKLNPDLLDANQYFFNTKQNFSFNDYDRPLTFTDSKFILRSNLNNNRIPETNIRRDNANTKLSKTNTENYRSSIPLLTSLPFNLIDDSKRFDIPIIYRNQTNKKAKTLAQYLYPVRPKGIEVGIFTGTSIISTGGYKDFHTFEIGALVNIKFSDSWRLWTSAYLTNLSYESEKMGTNGIPEISILLENWELEDIRVSRKLTSFEFGLQYNFRAQKSLQPFLGLGYGISSMSQNNIRYEIENEITDEDFFETRNFPNENQLGFLSLRNGVTYRRGSWLFSLEGIYRHRVDNADGQVPNDISSRLTLLYSF